MMAAPKTLGKDSKWCIEKPENGCSSHVPSKASTVTALGTLPLNVSSALSLLPGPDISTESIPAA